MGAIEDAEAFLASQQSSDLSHLSDEELIRHLPDEALLAHLQGASAPAAQAPPAARPSFLDALGLGLRETGVAALQGVNAASGGFLKSAYEHPIAPNPRLEALGRTPDQTSRVWPTPTTPEGQFMGGLDTILGSVVGLPGRAMTGAAAGLAKVAPKIPAWVARVGAGASGGLAFDVAEPDTYGRNAAIGAAGNVVLPPAIQGLVKAFKRPSMTVESLLATPMEKVPKLPPALQDLYIRESRKQVALQAQTARGQTVEAMHEAKIALNQLNRATLSNLRADTESLEKQLRDTAYQVALKLKTTDIGPIMTTQSTRYGDVVRSVIAEGENIRFTPTQLLSAIEKRFQHNPRAFNIAHDALKLDVLDEYGQMTSRMFSPQELVNEIDRIGLGIPRSPTQTYTFVDDVADDLRDVLLTELERAGSAAGKDFTKIRAAKQEWARWKPVQKRLVSGTRYFEQSETVTDAFVNKLMMLSRTDRTMNNEKYFGEIQHYLGRDFAAPMRPIVAKMTAIERQQVALEAARLAEMERIAIQGQASRSAIGQRYQAAGVPLANLEVRLAERAERAKQFWAMLAKIGIVSGTGTAGLYGIKKMFP